MCCLWGSHLNKCWLTKWSHFHFRNCWISFLKWMTGSLPQKFWLQDCFSLFLHFLSSFFPEREPPCWVTSLPFLAPSYLAAVWQPAHQSCWCWAGLSQGSTVVSSRSTKLTENRKLDTEAKVYSLQFEMTWYVPLQDWQHNWPQCTWQRSPPSTCEVPLAQLINSSLPLAYSWEPCLGLGKSWVRLDNIKDLT